MNKSDIAIALWEWLSPKDKKKYARDYWAHVFGEYIKKATKAMADNLMAPNPLMAALKTKRAPIDGARWKTYDVPIFYGNPDYMEDGTIIK